MKKNKIIIAKAMQGFVYKKNNTGNESAPVDTLSYIFGESLLAFGRITIRSRKIQVK